MNVLALVSVVLPFLGLSAFAALTEYAPRFTSLSPDLAERAGFCLYAACSMLGVPAAIIARRSEARRPTRGGGWIAAVGLAVSAVSCFILLGNYLLNY